MNIKKAYLLFEQSGTFKNAFREIGVDAFDFDWENIYNTTDFKIDIFAEILKAFNNQNSIFDAFNDGIVIAFFPCTYFSKYNKLQKRVDFRNYRNYSLREKFTAINTRNENSFKYLEYFFKLLVIAKEKNLKLVVVNPYDKNSFLYENRPTDPKFIDMDRRDMGDIFIKPTMFFSVNYELGEKPLFLPRPGVQKSIYNLKNDKIQRSLISPEYAKNFIKYILKISEAK